MAVDVVALMNCIAEDAGEPSADDLLAGYSTCDIVLDSSALRVPCPDLLLEAAHQSADYPTYHS